MVTNGGRLCNALEDGGINDASLNPRGILPRRILLDQRQRLLVAVEKIRSDKVNAPASKDVKLDHNSRLWWEVGEG